MIHACTGSKNVQTTDNQYISQQIFNNVLNDCILFNTGLNDTKRGYIAKLGMLFLKQTFGKVLCVIQYGLGD